MYSQNKAYSAQKKAAAAQRRQADLASAIKRRDMIRSNRVATANATLGAEANGASRSSGSEGGLASLISQGRSNLLFNDQSVSLSDQAEQALGKAASWGNTANIFGGISSMAMTAYSASGGLGTKPKTDGVKPSDISTTNGWTPMPSATGR